MTNDRAVTTDAYSGCWRGSSQAIAALKHPQVSSFYFFAKKVQYILMLQKSSRISNTICCVRVSRCFWLLIHDEQGLRQVFSKPSDTAAFSGVFFSRF